MKMEKLLLGGGDGLKVITDLKRLRNVLFTQFFSEEIIHHFYL